MKGNTYTHTQKEKLREKISKTFFYLKNIQILFGNFVILCEPTTALKKYTRIPRLNFLVTNYFSALLKRGLGFRKNKK